MSFSNLESLDSGHLLDDNQYYGHKVKYKVKESHVSNIDFVVLLSNLNLEEERPPAGFSQQIISFHAHKCYRDRSVLVGGVGLTGGLGGT